MPRDGSGQYHAPPGTDGAPDTTIDSARYNLFVADLEQVLNTPSPIISGGTGGGTPDEALDNLNAEKEGQVVTNYDSMVWMSGSFSSDYPATNPPIPGHAFSGIVYVTDVNNIYVEARDRDATTQPGPIYVRQKKLACGRHGRPKPVVEVGLPGLPGRRVSRARRAVLRVRSALRVM